MDYELAHLTAQAQALLVVGAEVDPPVQSGPTGLLGLSAESRGVTGKEVAQHLARRRGVRRVRRDVAGEVRGLEERGPAPGPVTEGGGPPTEVGAGYAAGEQKGRGPGFGFRGLEEDR